jgi:hypothetical protein
MTTKHTIATISLALVAFVFGCVTEAVVVPPVRANPNATRWQYKCIQESDLDGTVEDFPKLGAQGWELAGVGTSTNNVWCFKRPLP